MAPHDRDCHRCDHARVTDFEMWNRPVALKVVVWLVLCVLAGWRFREFVWGSDLRWIAIGLAGAVLAAILHRPRPSGTHPHARPPREREHG